MTTELSRRGLLGALAGATATAALAARAEAAMDDAHAAGFMAGLRGGAIADAKVNGLDPQAILRDFDHGRTPCLASGRVLREWELVATEREIELAPDVRFPAWTYNDRVPGPTLRAREDELLRVPFVNGSGHPHSIHFHGIHAAAMDGSPPHVVAPGKSAVYEFTALPFGLHLYHCHAFPLAVHVARGLYGAFLVDPVPARPDADADELVMVMNAFDTDVDGENEIYAANTIPFAYMAEPIRVARGELVRIHVVNVTEYDPCTDTVMLCQGQRGIAELRFLHPGRYMFHAHQSEFTELGWMGTFEVA